MSPSRGSERAILETQTSGPRVLRFDTSRQRPGEIVDHLLVEFGFS